MVGKYSINDVFKTQGQPTVTYVKRQGGAFEKRLSAALNNKGSVCLLTGPSKTGKTTLYTQVAKEKNLQAIQVRCHGELSSTEVWRKALESVNFDRVSGQSHDATRSTSGGGKIAGKFGWTWLADITGESSIGISSSKSEKETRDRILADPSPEHLIPILKHLPFLLVIEDFHYLKSEVQKNIFQQWKTFVDNEVSVIVVGTTHHSVDLLHANKDLVGRVAHIDCATWSKSDLQKIAQQGFTYLQMAAPPQVLRLVAQESVGLPIITQSICLQMLINLEAGSASPGGPRVGLTDRDAYVAFHQVAVDKYGGFSGSYDRIARGLRHSARRYNTYELILHTFALGELTFSLHKEDIGERLKMLPIKLDEVPPLTSVANTLSAMGPLQKKIGIELLEWNERDQRLYIIEPTFLFYLRWRKERKTSPSVIDVLNELLNKLAN